jgi:hypothetical protein
VKYIIRTWQDLERTVNRVLGLSATRASGSVANDGDGLVPARGEETYDTLLVDCKFTQKEVKSFSIKRADWNKTKSSAYRLGRIPIMASSDSTGEIIVHLDISDFARLMNRTT